MHTTTATKGLERRGNMPQRLNTTPDERGRGRLSTFRTASIPKNKRLILWKIHDDRTYSNKEERQKK